MLSYMGVPRRKYNIQIRMYVKMNLFKLLSLFFFGHKYNIHVYVWRDKLLKGSYLPELRPNNEKQIQ